MWTPWPRRAAPLALALQGGGAHGAFTWGVLDALLERADLRLAAISGASAGAMNAVVLAHGLLDGGRDGARAALARFWTAVGARLPLPADGGDMSASLAGVRVLLQWSRLMSPYQLNPLNLNPLRDVLHEQVDFERLRRSPGPRLHVATTQADSGRLRLFERHELTLEATLASACLPMLMHAVQIDGQPYWDGGYTANPALLPLVGDATDLLIVTLGAHRHGELPRSAGAIQARAAEIAFHAGFQRELQCLSELQTLARASRWRLGRLERRLASLRWHLIEAHEPLADWPPETRLLALPALLQQLQALGREQALRWLASTRGAVGRRSSADPRALFEPLPRPT